MIRVGFAFEYDGSWLGGVNYYRNLLMAVHGLPQRKIEPVIFLGFTAAAQNQAGFPPFQIVRSKLLDRHSMPWWARKIITKILARDIFLERLLRKNNIHVLSHSGSLGRGSRIPCLCWMADFQHRRMPQFFEAWEISLRDRLIKSWGQSCSAIVLSSHDAERDMLAFYPDSQAKLEVLQFVSEVAQNPTSINFDELKNKYAVAGKYFLVANQFWAHKNHQVIIDALKYLKETGRSVQVLATGNTQDYRQSGFYAKLMDDAKAAGVLDNFRVLGVIPYGHLAILMRNAVAIINPSLFEGWNTSVEEAKGLGKHVILSDIPVHREQDPAHAHFFLPEDARHLAEILWQCQLEYDQDADKHEMQKAAMTFAMRQRQFGLRYQEIILDLCRENRSTLDADVI